MRRKRGGLLTFGRKMKPHKLAGITHKPVHFLSVGLDCFYTSV